MAELFDITQGWTKVLGPFVLKNDGAALDLTGLTVRLMLRGKGLNVFIPASGQITVDPDQVTNRGHVYYKPGATDWRADRTPYAVKWELTDGAGDIVFVPNGEADTVNVFLP